MSVKFKLIFAAFFCVFAVSAYFLGSTFIEYKNGEEIYSDIEKAAVVSTSSQSATESQSEEVKETGENNISDESSNKQWSIPSIDFEKLSEMNEDIVGWIAVENTDISYPLLQGDDNQYYVNKAANLKSNSGGSIFLDYRNSAGFDDKNSVIYGHNLKNGKMFGILSNFLSDDYVDEHSKFYIITPDKTFEYEIFSAYKTHSTSGSYTINFKTDMPYKDFLTGIKKLSAISTDVDVDENSNIVTLSTCTNEQQTDRYVVHGKLVVSN